VTGQRVRDHVIGRGVNEAQGALLDVPTDEVIPRVDVLRASWACDVITGTRECYPSCLVHWHAMRSRHILTLSR
jgi:hypothetical protein